MTSVIGLVGLGKIVQFGHMPSYRRAGLRVVAGADLGEEAVSAFRREFGDVPRVSNRVEDVLSDEDVEVVDIATPPATHIGLVKAAIDAGKHVMCQKPLALSLDQAREGVAHAEKAGLQLAVNQNIRYTPTNTIIANWLREERIGKPHLVTFEYHAPIAYDPWRAALRHMVFSENMIHHIDLVRWWFGMPVVIFASEARSAAAGDDAATIGTMAFTYDDGPVVNFICDWVDPTRSPSFVIRIDGDRGSINTDGRVARCLNTAKPETWTSTLPAAAELWRPGVGYLPAFADCMNGFLEAIDKGVEAPTSGRDNLKTLELLFAAHRSIETRQTVVVGNG